MTGSSGRNGAGRGGPGGAALLGSIALHGLAIVAFWLAGRSTEPLLPPMKTYRVDIVSPPPLEKGPPQAGVAASEPPPAPPAPEPEPTPTAPKPEPVVVKEEPKAPPKPEAKPQPKPEVRVPQRPEPKPPAEAKAPPKAETPKAEAPKPEAPKPAAPRSSGANPKPGARAGGDGINIQIDGEPFPFPEYLNNIVLQISRYFRWSGASGLNTEIYFEILPNGSISGLRLLRRSGNMEFDLAAVEAVEQAGKQGAFGPLPKEFTGDRLPVSFYFEPPR